jgi:hypothetical protein
MWGVLRDLSCIHQGAEARGLNQAKSHAQAFDFCQAVLGFDRAAVVNDKFVIARPPRIDAADQRFSRIQQLPEYGWLKCHIAVDKKDMRVIAPLQQHRGIVVSHFGNSRSVYDSIIGFETARMQAGLQLQEAYDTGVLYCSAIGGYRYDEFHVEPRNGGRLAVSTGVIVALSLKDMQMAVAERESGDLMIYGAGRSLEYPQIAS